MSEKLIEVYNKKKLGKLDEVFLNVQLAFIE